MKIDVRMKSLFFDRGKVLRAVNAARRKALSKAGAFIRETAKRGIKGRVGRSGPAGHPPYSHVGAKRRRVNQQRRRQGKAPIRGGFKGIKHILFGYDPATESVVIGPVGLQGSSVPNVLEFGGTSTISRFHNGRVVEEKVRIAPHPYMGPALEKEKPKLPEVWANSVKGG